MVESYPRTYTEVDTRIGYTKVDGEVLYGSFDSKTFEQKYRGEAVYNQEVGPSAPT